MAALALAATPWLRAYHVPAAAPLLVVAAAAPVALAALAARRGVPAAASLAASAAGLIVLALAAAGPHPAGLVRGLLLGPSHLLSETLPLRGDRQLLALPLAVTWVAASLAGELDERADRSGAALAVAPLAFAGAWALTAAASGSATAAAAGLLAATAAAATLRQGRRRPPRAAATATPGTTAPGLRGLEAPGPLRPAATGLAASVAAVVLVAAAVPAASSRWQHPTTLRRTVPVDRTTVVDPVDSTAAARAAAEAAGDPATAVVVGTDVASAGYVATSVVDRYDGAAWAFDATFLPTGGRIPPPPSGDPVGAAGSVVIEDVTVGPALPAGPLPALDRPVVVTGTQVAADAATGMLLATGGRPTRYVVTSSAPAATLDDLPAADPLLLGAGADLPPGAAGDVAAVLRSLAAGTAQRPTPTVGWLRSAVALLRRLDRRSVAAGGRGGPSGTTLAEVIDATSVGRVATPEQFATLVAVVCRYLGVPARVATGYRITPGPDGRAAPGPHRLTERDAWTWAEVPVPGIGWVVADATPATTSEASAPPPLQVSTTPTTVAPRRAEAVPAAGTRSAHALARPVHVGAADVRSPTPVWQRVAIGLLAALAVLLLAPAAAALARSRRRAARRPAEPRLAAVGAWLEVLDGLERAGLRPPDAATPREVADEAGAAFGAEVAAPVRAVGDLAERAALSSTPVEAADAAGAWAGRREVLRTVRRGLDRRQRLRATLRVGHAPRRPTAGPGRRPAGRPS